MKFTDVPEAINKELIFNYVSEEDIFDYYGISVTDKKFCSPLRNDKNPTCNFYRNQNNTLIYKDWATNHIFDAIGFVMWKFNFNYASAIYRIYKDLITKNPDSNQSNYKGITYRNRNSIKITNKEPARIKIKRRKYNKSDLNFWNNFGITLNTLAFYNVYAIERAWLNDESVYLYNKDNPCYAYRFGYEEYKLYFPKKTIRRFLSSSSKIQGWEQLPDTNDILVITKSLKDVMLLYEYNIPAIAFTSESQVPDKEFINKLKQRFDNIILFYDNDTRGVLSMQKVKSYIPCIWIPKRLKAKDLTDYYKHNGYDSTMELINSTFKKLKL